MLLIFKNHYNRERWYCGTVKEKDTLYYARIVPKTRIYEVCEVIVRTVRDTWFVTVDRRDKRAYLFNNSDIDNIVFFDRKTALLKVLEAEEKDKSTTESEVYYEEY